MRLRPSISALLLAGLGACAGGGSGGADAGTPILVPCTDAEPEATVAIALPAFTPATLDVAPGTAVRFTNEDLVPHAIQSGVVAGSWPLADGALASEFAPGASICARYDAAGDHRLFDALYPLDMTAMIVVH